MVKKGGKGGLKKKRGRKKWKWKMVDGVTNTVRNLAVVYLPITFPHVGNHVAMVSCRLTLANDAIDVPRQTSNSTDWKSHRKIWLKHG